MNKALRTEAADPTTPPARLRELAKQGCAREVAGNPNTPTSLLLKLATRHFEAFLGNPVLPLLLLEDPGFCAKIPASALRRLLRRTELPASFLQTLARHSDAEVRDGARLHVAAGMDGMKVAEAVAEKLRSVVPARGELPILLEMRLVPLSVLEPVASGANRELREAALAALESSSSPEAQTLLETLRAAGIQRTVVGRTIGAQRHLDAEVLRRLARGGALARRQAAEHINTPPEVLRQLASDPLRPVQRAALKNRAMPPEVLWAFASSPRAAVRRVIALNVGTPPSLLAQLADDREIAVRKAVVAHWNVEPDTLKKLAGDPDLLVRHAVAGHLRTPSAVLAILAADPEMKVQQRAILHQDVPQEAIEQAARHPHSKVRAAAMLSGRLANEDLARIAAEAGNWAASDIRGLPRAVRTRLILSEVDYEDALALFAKWKRPAPRRKAPRSAPPPWQPRTRRIRQHHSDQDYARSRVAMSPQLTVEVAGDLAADPSSKVREQLAWNRETPPELLARLAEDIDWQVKANVAFNHSTPPEALVKLAKASWSTVRQRVGWNPQTPLETLVELSQDESEDVRAAVAQNKRAPEAVLRSLAARPGPKTWDWLAANPATPADLLAEAWKHISRDHRRYALRNENLSEETLAPMRDDPDPLVRAGVAKHPRCRIEWQRALADDPDSSVRKAVLSNPQIDPELAARFANSADPAVRAILAGNAVLAERFRAQFVTDPAPEVRAALVRHPWLTLDEWRQLVLPQDKTVHSAAATSPVVPEELLREIVCSGSVHPEAWPSFLYGQRTPAEVFEWVAREGPPAMRQNLAHNDRTPVSALLILARDPEVEVRRALSWNKTIPPEVITILADDPDNHVRLRAAENPLAPPGVLMKLLNHGDPKGYMEGQARKRLAENPRLSPEQVRELFAAELAIQGKLSRSSWRRRHYSSDAVSDGILAGLIGRPALPIECLVPLVAHPEFVVQQALWRRPDLPPDWRARLQSGALERAVRSGSLLSRLASLQHPDCDANVLARFAKNGRWIERYAVTQNPSASSDLVASLAEDANAVVRAKARERLAQ